MVTNIFRLTFVVENYEINFKLSVVRNVILG